MNNNRITVGEVVFALTCLGYEAHMQDIKRKVTELRGGVFGSYHAHYKNPYTYEQTIQKVVEMHCPQRRGFGGHARFESTEYGRYRLISTPPTSEMSTSPGSKTHDPGLLLDDLEGPLRKQRALMLLQRNASLSQELKALYEWKCQVCGTHIELGAGIRYAEAHHIRALGEPHNGPDKMGNMVCVCPNCHVKLDFHVMKIDVQALLISKHSLDLQCVQYHNHLVAKKHGVVG